MNKKDNPDLVRKFQYTVWLNTIERERFFENLTKANGMKARDFIRQMITKGYVQAPIEKNERVDSRQLLGILLQYRTHFKRISNFMKYKEPQLAQEVKSTASAIQKIIDRL